MPPIHHSLSGELPNSYKNNLFNETQKDKSVTNCPADTKLLTSAGRRVVWEEIAFTRKTVAHLQNNIWCMVCVVPMIDIILEAKVHTCIPIKKCSVLSNLLSCVLRPFSKYFIAYKN